MAITEAQNLRLTALLQALEPKMRDLNPSSKNFVGDQIKRHDEWGEKMFISSKQWAWLEDLYASNVGPLSELPDGTEANPSKDYEDPEGDGKHPPADDDDISF